MFLRFHSSIRQFHTYSVTRKRLDDFCNRKRKYKGVADLGDEIKCEHVEFKLPVLPPHAQI